MSFGSLDLIKKKNLMAVDAYGTSRHIKLKVLQSREYKKKKLYTVNSYWRSRPHITVDRHMFIVHINKMNLSNQ